MDIFDFDEVDDFGSPPSSQNSEQRSPPPRPSPSKSKSNNVASKPPVENNQRDDAPGKAGDQAPSRQPVKLSTAERIDNLQGMLDGVGQTDSLALRKQKASDLARACAAPYFRALLRQRGEGAEVTLVERVLDQIATSMESAMGDEETLQCLCGALYLLLQDRYNIVYIQRTLVGALVRLLKAAEDKASKALLDKTKAAASEPAQPSKEPAPQDVGRAPKFTRKKFCGTGTSRSAIIDELRTLIKGEGAGDEYCGESEEDLSSGSLALATVHRMLRDPQAEEEGVDDEDDGFESDGFGGGSGSSLSRTPSYSSRFGRRRASSLGTPMSEDGDDLPLEPIASDRVTEEHDDEGPGSIRWSLKEHMRVEGGLALLVKLVHRTSTSISPSSSTTPTSRAMALQHLRRGLDLLETLAYLNTDNQRFLVTYRTTTTTITTTTTAAPRQEKKPPRGGGRGGGGGGEKKTVVQVLVEMIREVLTLDKGDRPPAELQLAMLRVLVNLTHHNIEAIHQLLEAGGMEVLMQSLLRFMDTSAITTTTTTTTSTTAPAMPPPPPRRAGGGEMSTTSFDAKLLGLNVLTNCVEMSEECRKRLGSLAVGGGKVVQRGVEKGKAAAKGGDGTTVMMPVPEFMVKYLLVQIQPFAEQLDKDLTLSSPEQAGPADTSDAFEDKHAEHLVLAAYISLLLGCIMRDCPSKNRDEVLASLPNKSPRPIIRVLKAFLAFQKQVGVLTSMILDPIIHLIKELESPDGVNSITTTTPRFPSSPPPPPPSSRSRTPLPSPPPSSKGAAAVSVTITTTQNGGSSSKPPRGPSPMQPKHAPPTSSITSPRTLLSPSSAQHHRAGDGNRQRPHHVPLDPHPVPGFSFKPPELREAAELLKSSDQTVAAAMFSPQATAAAAGTSTTTTAPAPSTTTNVEGGERKKVKQEEQKEKDKKGAAQQQAGAPSKSSSSRLNGTRQEEEEPVATRQQAGTQSAPRPAGSGEKKAPSRRDTPPPPKEQPAVKEAATAKAVQARGDASRAQQQQKVLKKSDAPSGPTPPDGGDSKQRPPPGPSIKKQHQQQQLHPGKKAEEVAPTAPSIRSTPSEPKQQQPKQQQQQQQKLSAGGGGRASPSSSGVSAPPAKLVPPPTPPPSPSRGKRKVTAPSASSSNSENGGDQKRAKKQQQQAPRPGSTTTTTTTTSRPATSEGRTKPLEKKGGSPTAVASGSGTGATKPSAQLKRKLEATGRPPLPALSSSSSSPAASEGTAGGVVMPSVRLAERRKKMMEATVEDDDDDVGQQSKRPAKQAKAGGGAKDAAVGRPSSSASSATKTTDTRKPPTATKGTVAAKAPLKQSKLTKFISRTTTMVDEGEQQGDGGSNSNGSSSGARRAPRKNPSPFDFPESPL